MGSMRIIEAKLCEIPSQRFVQGCTKDVYCASVCMAEGFIDGHCRGSDHCCCIKEC